MGLIDLIGKELTLFIDSLYNNPEMEFEYLEKRYLVSGYMENNDYILRVDTIEKDSKNVFVIKNPSRQKCVEAFEKAPIFGGKTIYEAESQIKVLYG